MKGLILSLQFLTRIPIHINIDFNHENIRKSTFFFPLVGGLIGALAAIGYLVFLPISRELGAFATVLLIIVLTGGLHLDGLADTMDGFLSNKDKEKTLDIMKDSRIGAFGVIGLILIILLKYVLLVNMPKLPLVLILSLANSRLVAVIMMTYKKTARPNGLGNLFHQSLPKPYLISSAIIYMILLLFLNPIYIIPLLGAYLLGEFVSHIAYNKVDGLTGDVYGTIIEISEAISLILFMGVNQWILF
ncbi:MAG: adenosylcobinamide-GDP ribazoletransferase [Epulopiscium sp.]|nr:adenosylcobinamide-GDP ribazoletransferase [Candidatus Epulonipiscium sp.]